MNLANDDPTFHLRQGMYWLLICLSVGVMLGRVMAVDAVDRTALAKDRLSRIAGELDRRKGQLRQQGLEGQALEKELARIETQLLREAQLRRPFLSANDRSRWCTVRALVEPDMRVDGAPYAIDKVIQDPNWDTIDMVKHGGHLYSSKPPLMATLMAGIYWIIYHLTGMSLATHPFIVGRIMLVIINVIPLAMSFILLARLVERFGTTDWGRLFVIGAATYGTFLTTFAVAINNHLIAALCSIVAVYAVVPIWLDGQRRVRYFVLAGFFGALMAVEELPALALFAAISLALLCKAPRQTLLAYVPAAMVVAAAFFATNWIAHGSLTIPYMHRGPGENWYDYTYQRNGKEIESYWRHPSGIDLGEQSRAVYAFHVLVGHHGIFSLTPIWLLTVAGILISLWPGQDRRLQEWAALVGGVSLICIAFYLFRPLTERNYGGMTSGFRWVFWLAPLWLLSMLPAVDYLSKRRWTRILALVLLIISVFSASYPTWNPWTNPWIMDYMKFLTG
ncbi:MAG: hypothetical protein ABSG67_05720 [Thermoguttaceae bacterium]|jgi:hypothetical protein